MVDTQNGPRGRSARKHAEEDSCRDRGLAPTQPHPKVELIARDLENPKKLQPVATDLARKVSVCFVFHPYTPLSLLVF